MLLRSTTKPPILGILTTNIFLKLFVYILLIDDASTVKHKTTFFSIRGGFDQTSLFFYKGDNRASV